MNTQDTPNLQPITIYNANRTRGTIIMAYVVDQWGYHRKMLFHDGTVHPEYWTVTHVPSGGTVLDYVNKEAAETAVNALTEFIEPFTDHASAPHSLMVSILRPIVGEQDYTELLIAEVTETDHPMNVEYVLAYAAIFGNEATDWEKVYDALRKRWGYRAVVAAKSWRKMIVEYADHGVGEA